MLWGCLCGGACRGDADGLGAVAVGGEEPGGGSVGGLQIRLGGCTSPPLQLLLRPMEMASHRSRGVPHPVSPPPRGLFPSGQAGERGGGISWVHFSCCFRIAGSWIISVSMCIIEFVVYLINIGFKCCCFFLFVLFLFHFSSFLSIFSFCCCCFRFVFGFAAALVVLPRGYSSSSRLA